MNFWRKYKRKLARFIDKYEVEERAIEYLLELFRDKERMKRLQGRVKKRFAEKYNHDFHNIAGGTAVLMDVFIDSLRDEITEGLKKVLK